MAGRWPDLPDGLDMFAPLYRAFAVRFGWTPRQVDGLEVWEASLLLGYAGPPSVVQQVQPIRVVDGYPARHG